MKLFSLSSCCHLVTTADEKSDTSNNFLHVSVKDHHHHLLRRHRRHRRRRHCHYHHHHYHHHHHHHHHHPLYIAAAHKNVSEILISSHGCQQSQTSLSPHIHADIKLPPAGQGTYSWPSRLQGRPSSRRRACQPPPQLESNASALISHPSSTRMIQPLSLTLTDSPSTVLPYRTAKVVRAARRVNPLHLQLDALPRPKSSCQALRHPC